MISASDVPACPACGCREVHPVGKMADGQVVTFYACRQCGRDVTDAWVDVQPAPEPEPVIGPPPDPVETESIAETAVRLGIAATVNGASS